MNHQTITIPIQQLAAGSSLSLHAHIFEGSPGPTIYLQANLHGPEVFGTALLIELMQVLKTRSSIKGKLIIVPCANPMGVNQVAYNNLVGRWNPQSGINWNRTFLSETVSSQSIESKLALALKSLSEGADYVLDIHTTGSQCAEHLFTYPWMHKDFLALGVPTHLELDPTDVIGAFDESHIIPYLPASSTDLLPRVATWEVAQHGLIDQGLLQTRCSQLVEWLEAVWGTNEKPSSHSPNIFTNSTHLHAPIAGYYSWVKQVGDFVRAGETYAKVYQPATGDIAEAKTEKDFCLLGIYGVAATASGEQIAWIAQDKTKATLE